ncbi:hypothetical protein DRF60_19005 [Chryseobacterium elymi]|uniref:Uncharacterized protein n=1 Tax=Chryseobacterium elymi TaxID=395936 RepID=A0A3D9D6Z4_9FLAO|nr:STM3941 family protein [Chryseobacterium elymi]REC73782.1 hypothetical protein DRF60_19005 [Chryseobacterium elymi]
MKNIKKNSLKLSLIIVVMILILMLGVFLIMNPTKYSSFLFRNGMVIFIAGIINIIISTYCIYQLGSKLFDRNAIFSINSKGISDKINMLDYPNISWKDIIKIEEYNINNVPHLKVFVDNPQQYIKQKKGLKKWVLNFNYKKYHTPILLNSTYLSCSFDDLKKSILDSYKEYQNN